ncbi:DUF2272 domain-containing protein [Acaryochloris marina]|uniref:DUF2272 domain-containing protein n=1 Tax=Acaryochloris marina TaxID=155978 RepID=UPI001BAE757B|nr:DUF2272 domain-containing protein [Acaryochloris marina]QUY45449.1 DUF2272 domain-containing protein [Acaryochloris marina S15]
MKYVKQSLSDIQRYAFLGISTTFLSVLSVSPLARAGHTDAYMNLPCINTQPPTSASTFVQKVLGKAQDEWGFWGCQVVQGSSIKRAGETETADKYWQRVGDYWQSIGLNYTGKDTNQAWSASFISWVMKEAGAGNNFQYSRRHSTYIADAIQNKKNGNINAPFVGYKLQDYSPEIGDLVCYSRASWVSYNTTSNRYPSHCDIVVANVQDAVEVIGGNVKNSVSKKVIHLDGNGKVDDSEFPWFVVIKNNL